MDKLKMHTPNKVDENVEKIGALFPNALTETIKGYNDDGTPIVERVIDFDILKQELSNVVVEGNEERYQFTWPDKKKSILLANAPIAKTLRPCREESVDFDTTENLYIEGDNLDVLKLMQETYLNKVKMIYIDPPYNTGNDFVYEDDFAQNTDEYLANSGQFDEDENRLFQNNESNGRFHTDWLNMIYPRLNLSKDLLTEDGVIFISIDDNEIENLKKICNEIFGSENFVFQIAWRRTDNQPNIGKIARVKEYIMVYARNINILTFGKLPLTDKAKNEYRYNDDKGAFRRAIMLDKTRGRHNYSIKTKSGKTLNGPWMMKEEEFKRLDADGGIYWTSGGDEQPYGKIYLSESKGQIPNDFWGIEFGTNQRASLEVENLFKKRYFDFPKPVSLISTIITLGCNDSDIILDFFSGSATTAHAVMQLNAEDSGNRKFIMVQLPEETDEKSEAYKAGYKNICEIGKERIRRAGTKIREELEARSEKLNKDQMTLESTPPSPLNTPHLDIGFRVLKVDSTNMKDVFYNPSEYTQNLLSDLNDNFKDDRTPEDLLFQVMLDLGVPLSSKITKRALSVESGEWSEVTDATQHSSLLTPNSYTVFAVAENYLIACFDKNVSDEVVKAIAKQKPYYAVFRDSGIATDSVATNFEQIFATYSPTTVRKVL